MTTHIYYPNTYKEREREREREEVVRKMNMTILNPFLAKV
jgi:hypothetical protein